VQSRSAVTATVPDPPEAGNAAADPVVTRHLAIEGATTEELVVDDEQAEAAIRKQTATAIRARGTARVLAIALPTDRGPLARRSRAQKHT
jgi:hypothetical protein